MWVDTFVRVESLQPVLLKQCNVFLVFIKWNCLYRTFLVCVCFLALFSLVYISFCSPQALTPNTSLYLYTYQPISDIVPRKRTSVKEKEQAQGQTLPWYTKSGWLKQAGVVAPWTFDVNLLKRYLSQGSNMYRPVNKLYWYNFKARNDFLSGAWRSLPADGIWCNRCCFFPLRLWNL